MEINGGFSTQRVIKDNGQERRKCHATGNQKETGKEARESAHRQGQLQHLRLAHPPTEGRVENIIPSFISPYGGKHGMQN